MKSFTDINLDQDILQGLADLDFDKPTPIQEKVIPLLLERQIDLISLAQTGTGKTAAFGLPLIQSTDRRTQQPQSLILCPTRELCVQVSRDLEAFSRYVDGFKILAIYGGASIEQQIKVLRKGVQMIVATPGRLNDLINRGKVDISAVNYVVFDEADEMLQMGFQDELNAILAQTPSEKNTLLFSATISKEVERIAGKYMTEPVEIVAGKKNAGAENVRHEYYMVHAKDRYPALKRIVDNNPDIYSIVFCRTRQETGEVAAKLIRDGYNADSLHGDLSQAQRDQVMKKFRSKNLQILVATDVAARGLDVNDLTHVINYNLPDDPAAYTHRSGRTGRAGRAGISASIIHMKEQFKIKTIEKKINKKFKRELIPSGEEICRKQMASLAESIANAEIDRDQIAPFYEEISAQLASLDREELIRKFISREFEPILKYYKNSSDLNVKDKGGGQSGKRERKNFNSSENSNGKQKFTRFFLNVGRRDGIVPQGLIGKINRFSGPGRIKIGKIDIKRNTASLEADSKYTSQVIEALQYVKINGKTVSIEVDRDNNNKKYRSRKGSYHQKNRKFRAA